MILLPTAATQAIRAAGRCSWIKYIVLDWSIRIESYDLLRYVVVT
jgi:predicted metal-dependent hydrolase